MNLLLNRDFQLPTDGWFHVVPRGEFPHPSGVTQIVDERACDSIVKNFNSAKAAQNFPGLLVDFDHFSDDPDKPSDAAGWASELQNRPTGIWAQIRWSDVGESAVKGGRYRLVSPVFGAVDADLKNSVGGTGHRPVAAGDPPGAQKRVRPVRLLKLALTNDPVLRGMVPLSNRGDTANSNHQPSTPIPSTTMKTVCTLLGLSAEADEASVHAEVTKLKNRITEIETSVTPLKNRVTELEGQNKNLAEAQVEADLEKYKNRIRPDKLEQVKKQLLADRAGTLELLESLEAPAPGARTPSSAAPLHNRGSATQSGNVAATQEENAAKARAKADEYKFANRCTFEQAWSAVQRSHPELFVQQSAAN